MLVTSSIALVIAVVAFYISFKVTDEVVQLAVVLPALFCLILSLVFTPWSIKLLIAIALLASKKNTNTLIRKHFRVESDREMDCPLKLAFALAQRQEVLAAKRCALQRRQSTLGRICGQACRYAFREN